MFALALLLVNILAFALTFSGIVSKEYGSASPANMLEAVAADLPASGLSEETEQALSRHHIWAMLLDADRTRPGPTGSAVFPTISARRFP